MRDRRNVCGQPLCNIQYGKPIGRSPTTRTSGCAKAAEKRPGVTYIAVTSGDAKRARG